MRRLWLSATASALGCALIAAGCLLVAGCGGTRTSQPTPVAVPSGSPVRWPLPTPAPGSTTPTRPSSSTAPTQPGGQAVLFLQISSGSQTQVAGEVDSPDQVAAYEIRPAGADQRVRDAVAARAGDGVRLLLFLMTGCPASGATLVITNARVFPVLQEELPECFVADHFAALFAVPTRQLPGTSQLG
jgi:hypothetical protein